MDSSMTRQQMKEQLLSKADELVKAYPCLRRGQALFNYVDEHIGVARDVQFIDKVDCFYRDDMIDAFLDKVLDRIGCVDGQEGDKEAL